MSNLPNLVPFVFSFEVSKTDEQDEDEPVAIVVVDFQGDTKLAKRRKFLTTFFRNGYILTRNLWQLNGPVWFLSLRGDSSKL